MNPKDIKKNTERQPGGKHPHFDDRPAKQERARDSASDPTPRRSTESPDIPDYGDTEKSDPRRTNIEGAQRSSGSVEAADDDDGPVQTPQSPSM